MKRLLKKIMSLFHRGCLFVLSRLPFVKVKDRPIYVMKSGDYLNVLAMYPHFPGEIFIIHQRKFDVELLARTGVVDRRHIVKVKGFLDELRLTRALATSSTIFLNDTSFRVGTLKPRGPRIVVQLWHGSGAFKKFGLDSLRNTAPSDRRRLAKMYSLFDLVCVSAPSVEEIYAGSFGLPPGRVRALGVPRTDLLFDDEYRTRTVERLRGAYPQLAGKKVVLYAPTYRDDAREMGVPFDLERFVASIPEDRVLILKLHHMDLSARLEGLSERVLDLSASESFVDLMFVADLMITDYSSVVFEYALLDRPMLFFAHDLDAYAGSTRGFYVPFEQFAPGPIVTTEEDLIDAVNGWDFDLSALAGFRERYMSACDGRSAERVAEAVRAFKRC